MSFTFYLGTHMPNWLETAGVPLFVSRRRLEGRKDLPRAIAPWALDSGGFTEIDMHGTWEMTPTAYARLVRRFRDEIGMMDWAAPQDWMCEDKMLRKTGLKVKDHQVLTTDNLITLRSIAPDLPFIPVLQGQTSNDYLAHADLYLSRGIDLTKERVVGLGSVCRRQGSEAIFMVARRMWMLGINLHGFGVKKTGLSFGTPPVLVGKDLLVSSDSLVWSSEARSAPPLPGHEHKNCANCLEYALMWRERLLRSISDERPAGL